MNISMMQSRRKEEREYASTQSFSSLSCCMKFKNDAVIITLLLPLMLIEHLILLLSNV